MPFPEKRKHADPFPEPETFDDVIKFLRENCRVSQIWMQDADRFKMSCKDSNDDEDVAKLEYCIEIQHGEPEDFQREKITEVGLKLFEFWRELQLSKG